MTKQELEDAILTELQAGTLYLAIAAMHRVGTNRVQELAKNHGLLRKRGRKHGSKLATTAISERVAN